MCELCKLFDVIVMILGRRKAHLSSQRAASDLVHLPSKLQSMVYVPHTQSGYIYNHRVILAKR